MKCKSHTSLISASNSSWPAHTTAQVPEISYRWQNWETAAKYQLKINKLLKKKPLVLEDSFRNSIFHERFLTLSFFWNRNQRKFLRRILETNFRDVMLNTELLVDESDRLSWTEISFLPAQVTQDFELRKKKSQILGPKAVKKKKSKLENILFQKFGFNPNYFPCDGLTFQNEKNPFWSKRGPSWIWKYPMITCWQFYCFWSYTIFYKNTSFLTVSVSNVIIFQWINP